MVTIGLIPELSAEAARRAALVRDVAAARRDYRQGKVRRGTAADLMTELRHA